MMFLLSLFFILLATCFGQDPIVDTNYGTIRGFQETDYLDRPYDGFLGVPFAKPPVENLRWENPVPPEPWVGIKNTTEYSGHCLQFLTFAYPLVGFGANDTEDCLYLNVFVPDSVESALADPLPVMLFFYGGGYNFGTTEMYPCEELATAGKVVTVSSNYRVGVMGFFTTGDEVAPGNYGLYDTKTAIEWVSENIARFGGDPNRITILGHSVGGSAVSLNLLSPLTNNLFHRGIALSGGAGAGRSNSSFSALLLADTFDCNTTDSQEIVDCLREIDGHEVDDNGFGAGPRVDGNFIPQHPDDSWEQGIGGHIDFMTGYTTHDSLGFMIGNPIGLPMNLSNDNGNMDREEIYLQLSLLYALNDNGDAILDAIYERFPGLNDSDPGIATETYCRYQTDRGFGGTSFEEAIKHSRTQGTGATYHYEFHHRMSFLTYPKWVNGSHMDDIYALLGDSFMRAYRYIYLGDDFDEYDRAVSSVVMSYYANFAYTGNPNNGPHATDVFWPEYDEVDRYYFVETPTPVVAFHDEERLEHFNWLLYELPQMSNQAEDTIADLTDEEFLALLDDLDI